MYTHNQGANAPSLATSKLAHHDVVGLEPLGTGAARGLVTPTSEKTPDAANVEGPVRTEKQYLVFMQPDDDGKQFATLRAHLALKGYSLSRTVASDGPVCFYVTRWGMVRELRDLAGVARFLDQVGGAHA